MSKRFLTVGSLLREEELLKYKDEIRKRDDITYPFYDDLEGYKKVEDQSVADVVKSQKDHNLVQISDGNTPNLFGTWTLYGDYTEQKDI